MCGSALTGLGSADGLVSRVVGRVSVVVGASVVVAQAVTSSTRATPPNHLITRPSSRTVDWSIRIGAEARRGPLPIWNLNQEPVAAVEVRRLRSCWGGVSRRTSVRSGHWPTSHVQSPRAQASSPAVAEVSRTTSVRSGHWPTSHVQSRSQTQARSPGPGYPEGLRTDPVTGRPPTSKVPPPPRRAGPRYRERLRTDLVTGRPPASKVPAPTQSRKQLGPGSAPAVLPAA